jgi:hypothetical protein
MAGKASFDDVYDRPDPRAYFRMLETLDYQIPEHARVPFAFLARRVRDGTGDRRLSVLDLCCSYGVNAALLNCDLTLADLYGRYGAPELDTLSSEELIASDRAFYALHRRDEVPVVGLCDADEERAFRRHLGAAGLGADLDRVAMEGRGFFVCDEDLEDELLRALGGTAALALVDAQGDGRSFETFRRQPAQRGRPLHAQLRRFLGTRSGRKTHYGRVLVEALELDRVPHPLHAVLQRV